MLKVSFTQSVTSVTYAGALSTRSAACDTTRLTITPTKMPPTPKSSTKQARVARPRRQPRFARALTAGSIANDRNNDTAMIRIRPWSFSSAPCVNMKTATAKATARIARQNHLGRARSPTSPPSVICSASDAAAALVAAPAVPPLAGESGRVSVT